MTTYDTAAGRNDFASSLSNSFVILNPKTCKSGLEAVATAARILFAVLIPVAVVVPPANAAAMYRVTKLNMYQAAGINNLGQVLGGTYILGRCPAGLGRIMSTIDLYSNAMNLDLGVCFEPASLNNNGQMVGYLVYDVEEGGNRSSVYRACLYSEATITELGTLGGNYSTATSINTLGQIVGSSNFNDPDYHAFAFIYSSNTMVSLGGLGGNYSHAIYINDISQVAGAAYLSGDVIQHAFLYSDGQMRDLGTLGGDQSEARSVNNHGRAVGGATLSGGNLRAFLWENGSMHDLGTLGGRHSYANSINNLGQIVGYAYVNDVERHAFLYANGSMTDLGQLPELAGRDSEAHFINDHGQIVGRGTLNGSVGPFLLNPIVRGIDISYSACGSDPSVEDFVTIKEHDLLFVIVEGWTGVRRNPCAEKLLNRARAADLVTAGYCLLNFQSSLDGACQVREALAAFGQEARHLGFLAIDVENSYLPEGLNRNPQDVDAQQAAIARIAEAVQQVQAVGLRPVIYSAKLYWRRITGDTEQFKNLPLWWTQAGTDNLDDPDLSSPNWTFGGWTNVNGKQYEIDDPEHGHIVVLPWTPHLEVDLNVFDFGAFFLSNPNYVHFDPCLRLGVRPSATGLVLEWDDMNALLESATGPNGPWLPLMGTTSPYEVLISGPQRFYRLRD